MKKLLCLLAVVAIFVGINSALVMAADRYVDGKITSLVTSSNGGFVNINIQKVDGTTDYCFCYPDSVFVALLTLGFQTQSVCWFKIGGYGYELMDMGVYRNKSITNAAVVDEIRDAKAGLADVLAFIKTRIRDIYYWVYRIYQGQR